MSKLILLETGIDLWCGCSLRLSAPLQGLIWLWSCASSFTCAICRYWKLASSACHIHVVLLSYDPSVMVGIGKEVYDFVPCAPASLTLDCKLLGRGGYFPVVYSFSHHAGWRCCPNPNSLSLCYQLFLLWCFYIGIDLTVCWLQVALGGTICARNRTYWKYLE